MSQSAGNVVVVGGGLPGLFSALLISTKYPQYEIHLIEREKVLGGLYNSFHDERGGCFDHGMHLIYESCIEEIDKLIYESMNEDDWIVLAGNEKDIAGVYFNGTLSQESPYIDIRRLPLDIQRQCVADFFLSLSDRTPKASECSSANDFFRKRFGPLIANTVIEPILSKLWNATGTDLDPMATRVVLMDRICLYDIAQAVDLMQSELLRSRIAYPDQLRLPVKYRSPQRGLYPKKFGMFHVVKALEKRLVSRGVRINTETDIIKISVADGSIDGLVARSGTSVKEFSGVKLLVWSTPLFGLAPLLGVSLPKAPLDPPRKQVYVYLLLETRPEMGALYYFYCFDGGFHTYRVTNYSAYCPDAQRADGSFPVCVELHFDPGTDLASMDLAALAVEELTKFGVIKSGAAIPFSQAHISKAGFPILTLKNTRAMHGLRESVETQQIQNLVNAGQAPERGIFFLHDVLEHNFNAITRFPHRN